jgi:hypothetical protein
MKQTRAEHLAWCKQRAMSEYDYYASREGHESAARNAVTSMVSDLRKHDETKASSEGPMAALAIMNIQMMRNRHDVAKFIEGYN